MKKKMMMEPHTMIWDKFATIFKQPSIDNIGDDDIISLIDEQDDDFDNTQYIYPPMKRRRIDDTQIESKQEETVTGGECGDKIMTEMNDDQFINKEEACMIPGDMDKTQTLQIILNQHSNQHQSTVR